jgi:hypothetical protein
VKHPSNRPFGSCWRRQRRRSINQQEIGPSRFIERSIEKIFKQFASDLVALSGGFFDISLLVHNISSNDQYVIKPKKFRTLPSQQGLQ